jgi:transposase
MEWCRAYREDHFQGLVDQRAGGNSAKLSKLQIEELQQKLHQYTPKELFGASAGTSFERVTWRCEVEQSPDY